MRKEKEQEELWLQKEVIEFLRCASSTFFTAKRYEKLRAKAIKDGSRRKYKKSDVLAFVEYLQRGDTCRFVGNGMCLKKCDRDVIWHCGCGRL